MNVPVKSPRRWTDEPPAIAEKDFKTPCALGDVDPRGAVLAARRRLRVRLRAPPGEQFATEFLLSAAVGPFLVTTTLVPLVGVVVGYNAVSGERESGSLKLLSCRCRTPALTWSSEGGRAGRRAVARGVLRLPSPGTRVACTLSARIHRGVQRRFVPRVHRLRRGPRRRLRRDCGRLLGRGDDSDRRSSAGSRSTSCS